MKAYQLIELVNYTVNRIVPKQHQELEKIVILSKIKTILELSNKDLTQEQVLQIIYKELGVQL